MEQILRKRQETKTPTLDQVLIGAVELANEEKERRRRQKRMTIQEQLLASGTEKISVDNDHNLQRFFGQMVSDADWNETLCNNLKTSFSSFYKKWQREHNVAME